MASGPFVWLKFLEPGLWFKPLYRPRVSTTCLAPVAVTGEDIALISFTSGSTGLPKAIPRSHAFLQAQRNAVSPLLDSDRDQTDLVAFPVFVLVNLAAGRTSVLPNWRMTRLDRVFPANLSGWIETQGVTRALLPPALCEALAGADIPPSLTSVFTGGGPVFPDVVDRLQAAKQDLRIVAVYGSTEAEPIAELDMADVSPQDRETMSSGHGLLAGHPVDGIDVRIVDGEIVVAGEHVNRGYLDPARDRETKINEGGKVWHRTGDAGVLDEAGRLWLLGRHGAEVDGLHPFAVETSARMWPGVRRAALANVGGKPVLAVEGEDGKRSVWDDKARELGIGEVRIVPAIPLDRRHRSKVDYVALGKLLGGGR